VLSVIYKKMNGSTNCRLWHAFWHVTTIHCIFSLCIWFCDFIEPKYRSQSCDNTRTVIYILAKKKVLIWLQVRILDFYHKLFPWAWMIPFSPHCCCIHVYCDVCSWWLYATCLKIDKLHHPCNDNMIILGPCGNNAFFFSSKFQAGTTNFFVCAHAVHVMLHTHCTRFLIVVSKCKLIQFPQKQNNKSDWCWQKMALRLSHTACKVVEFWGYWSQVSDSYLTSFLPQTCIKVHLHALSLWNFFSTDKAPHMLGRL